MRKIEITGKDLPCVIITKDGRHIGAFPKNFLVDRSSDQAVIIHDNRGWNVFRPVFHSDVTIDGIQATVANRAKLLQNALFNCASGSGSGSGGVEYYGDGLTLHYDGIERGNNPLIWKDLIGSNDGTLENAVWLDKSLQFNGDARLLFTGDITPDYTIMMVAKRYPTQGAHPRLTGESVEGTDQYPCFLLQTNSNNYSIYGHGVDAQFLPLRAMPANVFVHLAMRYNSVTKTVERFENGIKASERVGTVDATSVPQVYLGGRSDAISGERFFNGEFCNYMVYDKALTNDKILNNYHVDYERFIKI